MFVRLKVKTEGKGKLRILTEGTEEDKMEDILIFICLV